VCFEACASSSVALTCCSVSLSVSTCNFVPHRSRVQRHNKAGCCLFCLCSSSAGTLALDDSVILAGAFVHRHCATLGLPDSIAALATHISLARIVNVRASGVRFGNVSMETAQKSAVFLPLLLVCKHVYKCCCAFQVRSVAGTVGWFVVFKDPSMRPGVSCMPSQRRACMHDQSF
jgi:hypothetical protein